MLHEVDNLVQVRVDQHAGSFIVTFVDCSTHKLYSPDDIEDFRNQVASDYVCNLLLFNKHTLEGW